MISSWQPERRPAIIENVRIIVVDDDTGVRTFMVNALSYCVNREVLSFRDAFSAWAYLQKEGRADILISDVDMPEMNGFELLQKVKARWPETVFIIMSGKADNENQATESGADAFLGKPFAVTDLFDIVQTYVVD